MKKSLIACLVLCAALGAFAQGKAPAAGSFGLSAPIEAPFRWFEDMIDMSPNLLRGYEVGCRWHVLPTLMLEPRIAFAAMRIEDGDFGMGLGICVNYWKNLRDGMSYYLGPDLSFFRYKHNDEYNMFSLKARFGMQYTIAGRLGLFADYGFGVDVNWPSTGGMGDDGVFINLNGARIGLVFYF